MIYHVARDGETLGEFSAEPFRDKIFSGEIQPTDHFWTEGMEDWKQVSEWRAPRPAGTPPLPRTPVLSSLPKPLAPVGPDTSVGNTEKRNGQACLALGALVPLLHPTLIFLSFGFITAGFVLAILTIVKGRPLAGAIMIAACPFAILIAFAMMMARR